MISSRVPAVKLKSVWKTIHNGIAFFPVNVCECNRAAICRDERERFSKGCAKKGIPLNVLYRYEIAGPARGTCLKRKKHGLNFTLMA